MAVRWYRRPRVEFRILGPLEVIERGRPLTLGGSRQRALLALLLTRANEVVSTDRLIDELWGAQPPRAVANALQYHVSQLRKALAPHAPIITREPGYLIRVEQDELDLLSFERLVEEAQRSPPEIAAQRLRDALALWRGPCACRPRARAVRAGRDPPPRGAPPERARTAYRSRPRARLEHRAHRRAGGTRP